jgi:hypothetical protein
MSKGKNPSHRGLTGPGAAADPTDDPRHAAKLSPHTPAPAQRNLRCTESDGDEQQAHIIAAVKCILPSVEI